MILSSVNHVAIIASNLDVSFDFYVNKLGFRSIERLDREGKSSIVYLDAGNCIIELFGLPDAPERLTYPEARGLRHLAFTVENFLETIETLTSKGINTETIRIDERTGKRMTFFEDPDHLPLEICEK